VLISLNLLVLEFVMIQDPEGPGGRGHLEAGYGWMLGSVLALGVQCAIGVIWCLWTTRASKFIRDVEARSLRYTPKWVVGWFVPGLNLVIPYLAVAELWEATVGRPAGGRLGMRGVYLLGGWWALWIVRQIAPIVGWMLARHAGDDLLATTVLLMSCTIRDGSLIAAAPLAILIVAKISQRLASSSTQPS
jgi:hypothetical protein